MSDDPLERLAAEEDWQKRAKKVERDVGRVRPLRAPRARRSGGSHRVSWVFLALLGLTAVSGVLLWTDTGPVSVTVFVFVLCGWMISLCLHEFAHALTAHRGGDDTIAEKGYLTLDPRRYGHPLLTFVLPLVFLILGGLPLPGGAVTVDSHRLRSRYQDALVSAAGPFTNFIAAIVLLAIVGLFGPDAIYGLSEPHSAFWAALTFLAYLQVASVILNLLPVPGLDGYGAIEPFLPESVRRVGNALKPYGVLILFAILYLPFLRGVIGDVSSVITDTAGAPVNGVAYGIREFLFWRAWF